jgi:signal transduction histidine kinase
MRLLRLIERARERRWAVLAVGVLLEVAVVLVIGTDDAIKGVRGIGGESAALLAVVGAVFAGPLVGGLMAVVGWALFFPLIAESAVGSLVALPVWTGAALLTGWLSSTLVRLNRERALAERQRAAAHALRAPIATIHGLVDVLLGGSPVAEPEQRILGSIRDETDRLLRSEVFESESTAA